MKKRTLSHSANILTLTVTVHHRSFATKTYLEKKNILTICKRKTNPMVVRQQ
jgi:hypothetical protein